MVIIQPFLLSEASLCELFGIVNVVALTLNHIFLFFRVKRLGVQHLKQSINYSLVMFRETGERKT